MAALKNFFGAVLSAISTRRPDASVQAPGVEPAHSASAEDSSPGQYGSRATVEVDPKRLGPVNMSYSPRTDGDPDPGEIVWTWVPFEERDGRGKDRPVLIVASEKSGALLAAQLTSKNHAGEFDYVPIGTGRWDVEGRESWVNLDRIFRVYPDGMRREATALDGKKFLLVAQALHERYGWK